MTPKGQGRSKDRLPDVDRSGGRYRSRVIEVEAIRWAGPDSMEAVKAFVGPGARLLFQDRYGALVLPVSSDKTLRCNPGSWLIRTHNGAYTVLLNSAFEVRFEVITPDRTRKLPRQERRHNAAQRAQEALEGPRELEVPPIPVLVPRIDAQGLDDAFAAAAADDIDAIAAMTPTGIPPEARR